MSSNNIIYGYFKKDIQDYVYIGQTINYKQRRLKHEKYDPFNPNCKEYNYPLSKGIRKNGLDAYECHIIEEVELSNQLDDREQYWIKFYNTYEDETKYNLTPGGSPTQYKFTYFKEEIVDLARDLLQNTSMSFKKINEITGISIVMLSEINSGTRRKKDGLTYPLRELTRGKQLTQVQIEEIKNILRYDFISNSDIAKKFGVSPTIVQYINNGVKNYHEDNVDYPIRKENYAHNHLNRQDIEEIYDMLLNTTLTFKAISIQKKCCVSTIGIINNGTKYILEGFNFPLRSK